MAIGRRNIKNNWSTALDAPAAAADTTLTLPQPWIDKLTDPSPSASEWYELTLDDGVQAPEIVRCTGAGTGTITVERQQQGTVAPTTWGAGTKVEIRITAELARILEFSSWVDNNLLIGPGAGEALIPGGSYNILIGPGAGIFLTDGNSNTAVGTAALGGETSGSRMVAIGESAGVGWADGSSNCVAVGYNAGYLSSSGAARVTLVGADTTTMPHLSDVLCLGYGAQAYTANTAVLGSESSRLANVYIGGGQRDSAAAQVTLQASAGSGTNKAGGTLRLAGGKSTGSGAPGKVIVATGTAGASGSAENTLTDRAEWDTAGLFWTYAGLKTGNPASPGRKTGCGLKHHPRHGVRRWRLGITRSKDRVRIETRNRALRPRGTAPHHPVERPGAD